MTDRWPVKPQSMVMGDKLAVFIGGGYTLMPLAAGVTFIAALQRDVDKLHEQLRLQEQEQEQEPGKT